MVCDAVSLPGWRCSWLRVSVACGVDLELTSGMVSLYSAPSVSDCPTESGGERERAGERGREREGGRERERERGREREGVYSNVGH